MALFLFLFQILNAIENDFDLKSFLNMFFLNFTTIFKITNKFNLTVINKFKFQLTLQPVGLQQLLIF